MQASSVRCATCFLQDVAYGVITLLVNLTNSYEKQEIMPELIELAKFAKHHIPQEHELDDQDFIDKRIWVNTFSSYINKCLNWAVVVAQLAERSLPKPEDPGSNPVIGNFY